MLEGLRGHLGSDASMTSAFPLKTVTAPTTLRPVTYACSLQLTPSLIHSPPFPYTRDTHRDLDAAYLQLPKVSLPMVCEMRRPTFGAFNAICTSLTRNRLTNKESINIEPLSHSSPERAALSCFNSHVTIVSLNEFESFIAIVLPKWSLCPSTTTGN